MRHRAPVALLVCALLPLPIARAADIHAAAQSGNLPALTAQLTADPSARDARDEAGRTPLHHAARAGQLEVIRLLLDRGADPNAVDGNGVTPLHSLASRGHLEAARCLLDHGAALEATMPDGLTPLGKAAQSGQLEVVRLLLARGAALEHRTSYQRTPLVLAARERGGVEVVRALLDAGAAIDARDGNGDSALDLAAWRGYADEVDLLLDRGASLPGPPDDTATLLGRAADKGLARLFARLVDSGADVRPAPDARSTLLHRAAAGGSVPIMEALAARGLDPTAPDANGWTPLHYAADMGRAPAVDYLLAHGAPLNARTAMGQTPLNVARERDDPDMVARLTAAGADTSPPRFPDLRGPWLGQGDPPACATRFAPGIVNARWGLHSLPAFSPDGAEALWNCMVLPRDSGYSISLTLRTRLVDARWTYPEPAVFDGVSVEDVPIISADGSTLYDLARRPDPDGTSGGERIWTWERKADGWANPRLLADTVNGKPLHWQFGLDRDHNVYLTLNIPGTQGGSDIYISRPTDGVHAEPANLGPAINTTADEAFPCITPDGNCLLFGRDSDIWMARRTATGEWSPATPLSPEVNTEAAELLPTLSADGQALFFLRNWSVYWIDAEAAGIPPTGNPEREIPTPN